ncbi:MAG TPA: S41 family peptidase [Blastocatellia bacterium]
MKKTMFVSVLLFSLLAVASAFAREPKLVRYPDYHDGKIVFTYLGDIWIADEGGQNAHRLTANRARDEFPRFSPDGKWVAFSSDRNGNMDVYIIPVEGGKAKQLTFHSSDDLVLGWAPDSKSVLFSSSRGDDFMPNLYTISIDGGLPRPAGSDMGVYGTYSPDGSKMAINRKAQVYWRKYYRGAYQSDVTVLDLAAKKFTDLTDFDGLDSWPMWAHNGFIYFVSDRDGNGLTNVWRVAEGGGQAEKITVFKTGDVRFPSISSDGKTIVFEHDFGIWRLDVATKKVAPIKLDISTETEENNIEAADFNSQVDDYALEPSGRHIVFSIHGEIFTAPVDEGDLRQITDNPARDKEPRYSPDGKWIAFISDRSGREEIYVTAADGAGEPDKITDLDSLKFAFSWSPDSKEIAYTTSDYKVRKYGIETKQTTELASSKWGQISEPVWSPDGKWIAFSRAEYTQTSSVFLIPSSGGAEKKVSTDSFSEVNPRFSPDGTKLFFIRIDGVPGQDRQSAQAQLYVVALERMDRDPEDPEERVVSDDAEGGPGAAMRRPQRNQPPKEIKIDWEGLKRRTHQVTHMPASVFGYAVAPDNHTVVFATTEPAGIRTIPVVYSIQDDGKRLTRISAGTVREEGEGEGGFFFGGGISSFYFSRDGRNVFFKEGEGVYEVPLQAAGGAAGFMAAGAGAGRGEATRRRISFVAKVKIDHQAEWSEMFDDAWRTMKFRFYDPNMHGKDWDAAYAKYKPLVEDVGDRQELLNIINEMIGELNASHTGAAPPPRRREGAAVSTGHLGLDLVDDTQAGRYKVSYIFEGGPCDKDWVKVAVGNYLIAIDGKPVKSGDNYWPLLNSTNRLNHKVIVTFNDKPSTDGAWSTRIEPVSVGAYSQLRYERWVKQRREMVDKLSSGRLGYLHIQAMNPPSLHKFEKELRENRNKEGIIIDERWNGGGNIEQELLGILVQREYQIWKPRGVEAVGRPFTGYFGAKVLLQNWRSASNSEMFPAGFRSLGLGKVIGTPTMGAVIGTGSYSLIDGSTVRTPGVGVYLADQKRTNMEGYGVKPDIFVENSPEDNLAGRDRQLETCVQELLKELGSREARAGQ